MRLEDFPQEWKDGLALLTEVEQMKEIYTIYSLQLPRRQKHFVSENKYTMETSFGLSEEVKSFSPLNSPQNGIDGWGGIKHCRVDRCFTLAIPCLYTPA